MKRENALLCLAALAMAVVPAFGQVMPVNYYDMHCSGFITDQAVEKNLFVVSSPDAGFRQALAERDIVYLSRGAGYMVNPGATYILVREVRDNVPTELFPGQKLMMKGLGKVYAEIGQVKVNIVHEQVATAEITQACEEVQPGDLAVPLSSRSGPKYERGPYDRFAPRSGKNEGVIVTGKGFTSMVAVGSAVYLNIGATQGVAVGQLYRVFRTYSNASKELSPKLMENTSTHVGIERQRYALTKEQKAMLPRDILGELVIISVHGKSATALVTKSGNRIFAGDEVELQ